MKVLLVYDKLNSVDAQSDFDLLISCLPTERVQIETCTLQPIPTEEGKHSLRVGSRFALSACRQLMKLIRDCEIELIHAIEPLPAFYAGLAGKLTSIPVLASCYRIDLLREVNWFRWRQQQIRWRFLRYTLDRVIVPSEIVRKQLWFAVNFPRNRTEIVYPGVDFPADDLPIPNREVLGLPDGPLVTMILPEMEDPGYETVLDALPRLKQRVPNVNLAVVGSGNVVNRMQRKAAQIRPALPVRWLGPRTDIRDIIAASDVIVAHSSREGVPRALIEAAAYGKPVVAARIAGITEVVEPLVTGLLVTPGDLNDFAIQVGRFLTQPNFAARVGSTAKRRARDRFSLEAQRDAMTVLYESTIYSKR